MIDKFLLSLSFFTRLPVGKGNFPVLSLADCVAFFPIVGAIIGALDWSFYTAALFVGVPKLVAAWLTVIFHIILTGALHEDGLADTADGLASGRNKEQKLAIMRDSRIGTYGVLALISIIALRANITAWYSGNFPSLLAFMAASACSRSLLALMMRKLPPARADGLASISGRPTLRQTLISVLIGFLFLLITHKILAIIISVILLFVIYNLLKYIFLKNFGGITGDTLGAAQQISEVALLLVFLVVTK